MRRFLLLALAMGALLSTAVAQESQDASDGSLTVIAYNIRVGLGMPGSSDAPGPQENLAKIAAFIAGQNADVVLLQEVDRLRSRTGGQDQVAVLGEATGMHTAFAPAIVDGESQYGIAILSREPLEDVRAVELPRIDYSETHPDLPAWFSEQRVALVARIPGGVTVIDTHLGLTKEQRGRQVRQLAEIAASEREAGRAVVLGGDLNAEPDAPELMPLRRSLRDAYQNLKRKNGLVEDMPIRERNTFPADEPDRCIDYLFVDGDAFDVTSVEVPEVVLSDHRPVVARLRRK